MIEYINLITGEVLYCSNRIHAYIRYRVCTPKKFVKWCKIITTAEYYKHAEKYGFVNRPH